MRPEAPQSAAGGGDAVDPGATAFERAPRAGWAVAIGLFVLLVAGAALEFSRERRASPAAAAPAGGVALVIEALRDLDAPVIRQTGVNVPLRPRPAVALGVRGAPLRVVLSDDRPDSGVWSAQSTASATTLRRLAPDRGLPLRLPTTQRPDAVDVAQLGPRAGLAAVLVDGRPDGSLHLDVWRLSSPSPALARRYVTPRLARLPGSRRTVLLGRWSGPRPDLFVLDRASRARTMRVRVLAGEAGFRSTILSVTLGRADGFDPRKWDVDLQDLTSAGRSDIVFTNRGGATASGNAEVHALAAVTNFSRYLLQVPTSQPAARMAGQRALVIRARGQAQWLLVNPATGAAVAHPLLAAPPPPRTP